MSPRQRQTETVANRLSQSQWFFQSYKNCKADCLHSRLEKQKVKQSLCFFYQIIIVENPKTRHSMGKIRSSKISKQSGLIKFDRRITISPICMGMAKNMFVGCCCCCCCCCCYCFEGGYFLLFFILRQDIGVRENYSGLSMKRFVVVSLFLCWWARDL